MEQLLSRSASVNQLAILLAAEVFDIGISVYYPHVHNKTGLYDHQRKTIMYNDSPNNKKNVSLMWCSTFGLRDKLPQNWDPTSQRNYDGEYLNHFEPLIERENVHETPQK